MAEDGDDNNDNGGGRRFARAALSSIQYAQAEQRSTGRHRTIARFVTKSICSKIHATTARIAREYLSRETRYQSPLIPANDAAYAGTCDTVRSLRFDEYF